MSAACKTLTSAVSAAVLAAGLALGTAGPASAATCPSSAAPVISGASANWSLRCSGNNVTVSGWLQDTRADGKCAKVRINAGNGVYRTKAACSSGVREQFTFTFKGTKTAQVRLAIA
ncbi:hypothetical protein [Streptomyces sp. NPDC048332]|uniref:hypothetical protein n=1 Tax=Streptomyces sp. NPDC048332 TaxID=3154619 RepID=UPI00342D0AC3